MTQLRTLLSQTLDRLAAGDLTPIEVAVVDSGVDATHPDLADRVVGAYAAQVADDSATIEPCEPNLNNDAFGHGTAVASIIAKIAPNARIVDVRVLGADNTGAGAALLAGLEWSVERRSPIINMSLAARKKFASGLVGPCERAYRQGQTVVAAKRNMPLVDLGFPAEFSSVVSVDQSKLPTLTGVRYQPDEIIEYIAHGQDVVVAAPGGGYTSKTGTSFATPAVSGICALLLGAAPSLRPFEIKALLKSFAASE